MNFNKKPVSSRAHTKRATYGKFGALLICAVTLGTASLLSLPRVANAFSFFGISEASNSGQDTWLFEHTKLALLDAATNLDPNPFKNTDDIPTTEGSALIANSGPEGTAADVESHPQSDQISLYVVRPGDTLSEIADMFGVTPNTILWANNLKNGKDIHPGQTLLILPVSGIQHTVLKGETLASLAKKYGADAGDIASFNGLPDGAPLTVGSSIIIPGGELAAAATPSKTPTKTGGSSPSVPKGLTSGGGKSLSGFWTNPLPGGILTQGVHDSNAVDIGAKSGAPIRAAGGGRVIFVSANGSYNHGWGNDVIIDHGNGTQTLYAHMSRVAASVGETVDGGDVIGYVGVTGRATGPHLHFEVRGARNPFAGCAVRSVCSPQ